MSRSPRRIAAEASKLMGSDTAVPPPVLTIVAAPTPAKDTAPRPLYNVAEFEAINWNDPASVAAYIEKIGSQLTTGGIWAAFAMVFWMFGRRARQIPGQNAAPDVAALFSHYRAARDRVKAMSDTTADTYRSAAKACTEVAFAFDHEAAAVLRYIQEKIGSVGWSERGGLIRRVAEKFPNQDATFDQVVEAFKSVTVPPNLTDRLDDMIKALAKLTDSDDYANLILADEDMTAKYKAIVQAVAAARVKSATLQAATPPTPRGKKAVSDKVTSLKATLA